MAKKKVSDRHKDKQEAPVPKGRLLAIGGHEDKGKKELTEEQSRNVNFEKKEILQFLVSELKGENPMIAIVPTASTVPAEIAQDYREVFQELGVKNIEVIDIRKRPDARNKEFCDIVERAAGIMFPGGDQLRLTSILGGTSVLELMKERFTYDEDIIIAGTSAGATAMSTPMIYEGETKEGYIKGDVRITTGLEFLKNIAIDTHFIERGRIVRMSQCIATNPGCIGIGLESDTAIYVTEGKHIRVIGSGLITVVDGMGITDTNIHEIGTGEAFTVRDMRVHLLSKDECYTIPTFDQLHA
ncbi:cyanophycinase [Pontibacter diazotrophicus]|uniref:Cyanophycinase n=1 Tax=Pontibacter diazotrophicus TaxID=1400979 RepID=A0A3D8LCC5_9BACT|nr:cyanophycinase [Pontibacter diazotrophicus]RDV14934.1 cyanophycinase [Pontibacter diazotrophicus]